MVHTTPGPETTLMTLSGSPTPWKAPAMKGLSSTVAEDHQLGAAKAARSAVRSGQLLDGPAHHGHTASMSMPACGAHIDRGADESVVDRASGDGGDVDAGRPGVMPPFTRAEKLPIKATGGLSGPVQSQRRRGVLSGRRQLPGQWE